MTTGNSTNNKREIKIWDIKKYDKPILDYYIDNHEKMIIPHYDSDLDLFWLGYKGDNIIKYYEYTKTGKFVYLNEYKGTG